LCKQKSVRVSIEPLGGALSRSRRLQLSGRPAHFVLIGAFDLVAQILFGPVLGAFDHAVALKIFAASRPTIGTVEA
jgi:hypothetical protein